MDATRAKSFAKEILPWIVKKGNLPRNSFDQPLPIFDLLSPSEIEKLGGKNAGAAYSPAENRIIFPAATPELGENSPAYVRSMLVHELVHFLQHVNGLSFKNAYEVYKREIEAYRIQNEYLIEFEGRSFMEDDVHVLAMKSTVGSFENAALSREPEFEFD
jgi:hypothetical protein